MKLTMDIGRLPHRYIVTQSRTCWPFLFSSFIDAICVHSSSCHGVTAVLEGFLNDPYTSNVFTRELYNSNMLMSTAINLMRWDSSMATHLSALQSFRIKLNVSADSSFSAFLASLHIRDKRSPKMHAVHTELCNGSHMHMKMHGCPTSDTWRGLLIEQ